MAVSFDYRLQVEAVGKTNLGREVHFLVEHVFTATVDATHYNYETGKIVSTDTNGDFEFESIREMMEEPIREYCLRYSIVPSTVQVFNYTVHTSHPDVVVYFNPTNPSTRTTDGNTVVYAYYIYDSAPPFAPLNVTCTAKDGTLVVSWNNNRHHHGIRIYNDKGELLVQLGQGATEWIDDTVQPDTLYTYYVAAYNEYAESTLVKISGKVPSVYTSPASSPTGKIPPSLYRPLEQEEGPIPAFQSGVGDLNDLKVSSTRLLPPREIFEYTMQLKGYEEKTIQIYPEREFQYRILAYNAYGILVAQTPWRIGIIDGKEPLNYNGAGKEDLRLPLDIAIPDDSVAVEYTIELNDPSGVVEMRFDKGTAPSTTHSDDYVTFFSREDATEEITIKVAHYGPKVKGKGIYIVEYQKPLILDEELPSPTYDPVLSTKNIKEWVIILQSQNPNVRLTVVKEPEDYLTERHFLRFKIAASIINHTQTPWNPLIHSGYYYLNQSEHYLYSESKVQGKIIGDIGYVPLRFTYAIEVSVEKDGIIQTYSTSIAAEVPSDQKLYRITERPIRDIMQEVLVKQGIPPSDVSIVDYALHINETFPVSISARDYTDYTIQYTGVEMGEGYVYAQTTGIVSEHIYDDLKVKVNENNEAFVSPIPQRGAPVIIQDASGEELTQVSFYTEDGKPTLDFTEILYLNSRYETLLSFVNVDPDTLKLEYEDGKGEWHPLTDYTLQDNYLQVYPSIPSHYRLRATYRLRKSFYVDYNYNVEGNFAKIVLHNPTLDENQELKIFYETNTEHPYYIATEIDLNPMKNIQNAGFIYLANQVEPSRTLELYVNPKTMYANGYDATLIRAIAKDRFGNPVIGETISFSVDKGTIEVLQGVTDVNGMAIARLTAPAESGVITVTAINTTTHLEATEKIYVKEEALFSRMTVSTSHPTIYPGLNAVEITAYVYGENQEPVIQTPVEFEVEHGVASATEVMTNQFGAASIVFAATEIPRTGIIRIRAKATELGLYEDTVLRIEGFRHYHPDYFVAGNNLIDIYDRHDARHNLGIATSSAPPADPELYDLWIDQSDILYLMQSYNLRDVYDRDESRRNLGITVDAEAPSEPWPNDLWIEKQEE